MAEHERNAEAGADGARAATLTCPHCGSADVEELGVYGSQLMTRACYCRSCHTPFEAARRGLG